jgi:hypothetical protein
MDDESNDSYYSDAPSEDNIGAGWGDSGRRNDTNSPAIDRYNEGPTQWNRSNSNAMPGQDVGPISDLKAWLSRNGIYSQVGAGQTGALDGFVNSGAAQGLLGFALSSALGPASFIANPLINRAFNSLRGRDSDTMGDIARGGMGILGGNILGSVNPALGQLGGILGRAGFDKVRTMEGTGPGIASTTTGTYPSTQGLLSAYLPKEAQQAVTTAQQATGNLFPFQQPGLTNMMQFGYNRRIG